MKYVWATGIFIAGELVSLMLFAHMRKRLGPPASDPANRASTGKGVLERAVLLVGLLHGFPQILIAFGALKLGTRFQQDKESKISNTYFLVGNLTSILLAMLYAIVTRRLWGS